MSKLQSKIILLSNCFALTPFGYWLVISLLGSMFSSPTTLSPVILELLLLIFCTLLILQLNLDDIILRQCHSLLSSLLLQLCILPPSLLYVLNVWLFIFTYNDSSMYPLFLQGIITTLLYFFAMLILLSVDMLSVREILPQKIL